MPIHGGIREVHVGQLARPPIQGDEGEQETTTRGVALPWGRFGVGRSWSTGVRYAGHSPALVIRQSPLT